MKKKLLYLFILIYMVFTITACGNRDEKNTKQNVYSMLGLSESYVWISTDLGKYNLVDLNGSVIYSPDETYIPSSKVIGKYFFLEEKESKKPHLFNLSGEELFADSDKVELKSAHKNNKFTSDYSYAVSVWYSTEENENDIKLYLLDDELTEITNNYVNGNYALTDMYHVNDADGINRPDLLINPTGNKFYEYYLKMSDGAFTLVKNGNSLYEPINGTVKVDNCGTYNIISKIGNTYYIVSEDGTTSEISYIPYGYNVDEYCNGYIIVSATFVNSIKETKTQAKLFGPDGLEINLIK